ncbi:MAG TPA: hypothetical protein VFV49_01840 [Thermoanaerobaculia bacterium]|nr:hypothetical protein [Thermoanaerobaculia bacterium]
MKTDLSFGTATDPHLAAARDGEARLAEREGRLKLRFASSRTLAARRISAGVILCDAMSSDAVAFVSRIFPFLRDVFAAAFVMHSS